MTTSMPESDVQVRARAELRAFIEERERELRLAMFEQSVERHRVAGTARALRIQAEKEKKKENRK
ncbi:MAG: hypothetical protein LBT89_11930 [Planctomycetaceae bacterium]|jgi:hypothetical protein|nr:hypothetical protein [Planctomycetaceae bacterium]